MMDDSCPICGAAVCPLYYSKNSTLYECGSIRRGDFLEPTTACLRAPNQSGDLLVFSSRNGLLSRIILKTLAASEPYSVTKYRYH